MKLGIFCCGTLGIIGILGIGLVGPIGAIVPAGGETAMPTLLVTVSEGLL